MKYLFIGVLLAGLVSPGCKAGLATARSQTSALDWPRPALGVTLMPEVSWDALAEGKNPRAGLYLPDYGGQSPAEVNRTINLVWKECRSLDHRPGARARDVAAEIGRRVDKVRQSLPYPPTEAHLAVMKATGCDTFLILNGEYGAPRDGDRLAGGVLDGNWMHDDRKYRLGEYLDACLSLPKILGGCGHYDRYTSELYTLLGLRRASFSGTTRDERFGPVRLGQPNNPMNHAWSGILVPNRRSVSLTPEQRSIINRRQLLGREALEAVIVSDNTWGLIPPAQRDAARRSEVFPRPAQCLVGAKGDDAFRLLFWMRRVPLAIRQAHYAGAPILLSAGATLPQGPALMEEVSRYEGRLLSR